MAGIAPLAHGIGVRGDLPLPLSVVAYGAIGVLVISFVALGRLWRQPRLSEAGPGAQLPDLLERALRRLEWPLRLVGVAAFAITFVAAVAGSPVQSRNLAPVALYVALWVGGIVVSALVGDLWAVLNPFATLAKILTPADGETTAPPWMARVGVWPAALLLLAYTWLELVHPNPSSPTVVAVAIAVITAVLGLGAVWWGPRWIRAADPFGALFRVLGAMAPVHQDAEGHLRIRPPLRGLATMQPQPGLAALVLVALGSTSFDGLSRTGAWVSLIGDRTGWAKVPISTLGLVVMIGLVSGVFLWAVRDAAQHSPKWTTPQLVEAFVPSLVPIVFGYAVAHYFSLLVFEGQAFLALLSDPLDLGWNLLGTAGWRIDYTAVSTTTIAVVQVAAIVGGHLAAVVLAHDRAVEHFDGAQATRSQYALLVAMVAYTVAALVLLLSA